MLKAHEIQWLVDKFNLNVDLEEGTVVASRKDGKPLKVETVRKMTGRDEAGMTWREDNGRVKGL
jgi:hypothetical protein